MTTKKVSDTSIQSIYAEYEPSRMDRISTIEGPEANHRLLFLITQGSLTSDTSIEMEDSWEK